MEVGNTIRILDIPDKELFDINEPEVGWTMEPMRGRIGVIKRKYKTRYTNHYFIRFKDGMSPSCFWAIEESIELYNEKELKLI